MRQAHRERAALEGVPELDDAEWLDAVVAFVAPGEAAAQTRDPARRGTGTL